MVPDGRPSESLIDTEVLNPQSEKIESTIGGLWDP